MYCPNCGKQIKENDNFCRYCGFDLRADFVIDKQQENEKIHTAEDYHYEENTSSSNEKYELPSDNTEELASYDVKKHRMALFWPVILTPVFFIYFWNIFLNTHSIFSWLVVLAILAGIIYPILRYTYDKIIITTKYVHIKIGVLNPVEIDLPLSQIDRLDITQTSMGKLMDYGMLAFTANSERYDYKYIQSPGDLRYIIDNPARFVKESLSEDVD